MEKVLETIIDFIKGISEKDIFAYSSSCAYYTFICVIPFLTITTLLVAYTPLTREAIYAVIYNVFPNSILPFISNIIEEIYSSSSVVLPITLIIMLWTVSGITVSLRRGLNKIYGVLEQSNFIVIRLFGTLVMVIFINIIILGTFVGNFSAYIIQLLSRFNSPIIDVLSSLLSMHTIFTLVSFFVVFTLIYSFLSATKKRLKYSIPGAIFTTFGAYVYIQIYNYILANYLTYSMYGSLATIVMMMAFFNILYIMFFLGAYLNQYLEAHYFDKYEKIYRK